MAGAVVVRHGAGHGGTYAGPVGRLLGRVAPWHWLCAATTVVLVVTLTRRVSAGYVPQGDNAFIEARSRAVISGRPPLLNMLSTVSAGGDVYHPGPLLFDLLALPVRIGPHGVGLAIGTVAINVVAVWASAWCASRFAGQLGASVVAAATALLVWSFGSDVWFDAWQPNVAMLPYFLALVACWGFAYGATGVGPWMVAASSFVVQTHSSYLIVMPPVVLVAVVLRRICRRGDPVAWRGAAGLVAFGLVLWLQPLIQQFFGAGPGNLGALLRTATADRATFGVAAGLRVAGEAMALPPWFTRAGVGSSIPTVVGSSSDGNLDLGIASLPVAVMALAVAAGVLVAVSVAAWRLARDPAPAIGAALVASAVVAGVALISRLPVDEGATFVVHKVRWLWPLGAFGAAIVVVGALRASAASVPSARFVGRRAARPIGALGALVMLVASVPTAHPVVGLSEVIAVLDDAAIRLRSAVTDLPDDGIVYVPFEADPVSAALTLPVLVEMEARGVEFVSSTPLVYQQFEGAHRFEGHADATLYVELRSDDTAGPDGRRVVAEFGVAFPEVVGDDPLEQAVATFLRGRSVVRMSLGPFDPATALTS